MTLRLCAEKSCTIGPEVRACDVVATAGVSARAPPGIASAIAPAQRPKRIAEVRIMVASRAFNPRSVGGNVSD